jgi:HAD superfamily hydrolase (TIGR01459 family)
MLDALDVARDAYDGIVSSGDLSKRLAATYEGQAIHWVGPPEHRPMIEGLDLRLGPPEQASVVIVSDPDSCDDTLDLYEDRLAHWKRLGLPMICANPDKVVEVGDRLELCAGALADRYAEMGGEVVMAGKPFPPIYEAALELLANARGVEIGRSRVLAIGDSARTDATGAARMGIDFLFITGSIHAEELHRDGGASPAGVQALLEASGAKAVGHMARLVW